jgi:L-fuconolactonase
MKIIDSHQHFWKYEPVRDAWISEEMTVLRRDFLPEELDSIYKQSGISGCVAVQADQSLDETHFLVHLAREYSFIKGVVGWVNLRADNLLEELEYMKTMPAVKGFRHIVQGEDADIFLKDANFCRGIAGLESFGYTYDILVFARQLPAVRHFVNRFPNQPFVLDHGGKPYIRGIMAHNSDDRLMSDLFAFWKKEIALLAQHPNVCCKLSGLTTEADWNEWKYPDILPFMDVLLESFGPGRLMVGSDWPVSLLAAKKDPNVIHPMAEFINELSIHEQQKIYSGTATSFYRL